MGALFTAHHLGCKAILALTESGSTALWMSRHNIKVPIYGLTSQQVSQRKMTLYRNVRPLLMPSYTDRDAALRARRGAARRARRAEARRHLCDHLRRADGLPGRHQHAEGLPRRVMAGALTIEDIRAAAQRLRGEVVDTPCLHSRTLSASWPAARSS